MTRPYRPDELVIPRPRASRTSPAEPRALRRRRSRTGRGATVTGALADHRRGAVRGRAAGPRRSRGGDRPRGRRRSRSGGWCRRRSRGALVKRLAVLVDEHKADVGELVSIEAGKIPSEALGEVQEMIDICDFAVGLSRQLDGRTMRLGAARPPADGDVASARRGRRDHGLQLSGGGVVLEHRGRAGVRRHRGVEAVADDSADRARLLGAARRAPRRVRRPGRAAPLVVGGTEVARGAGRRARRGAGVSATGSERMGSAGGTAGGRALRPAACSSWAATTRRSCAPSADLELATRGIVFAAAGTAGQRCTTLRRLIVARGRRRRARRPARRACLPPAADRRPARPTGRWSGR